MHERISGGIRHREVGLAHHSRSRLRRSRRVKAPTPRAESPKDDSPGQTRGCGCRPGSTNQQTKQALEGRNRAGHDASSRRHRRFGLTPDRPYDIQCMAGCRTPAIVITERSFESTQFEDSLEFFRTASYRRASNHTGLHLTTRSDFRTGGAATLGIPALTQAAQDEAAPGG